MPDVVIAEAVRTPVGKRNGGLASLHPADLLPHLAPQPITFGASVFR